MRPLAAVVCSLLVLGFSGWSSPVIGAPIDRAPARERADGGAPQPDGPADARARADGMSLDRAVEMVQKRYDAKVVRAEEARDGGDVVYRIRLLSADGRVFTVRVNARTGQID